MIGPENSKHITPKRKEAEKRIKKKMVGESWAGAGSAIASMMFVWAMARQFFPGHFDTYITIYATKLMSVFYPYIEITFPEYSGGRFTRSEAYCAIESYLTAYSTERARRLKAEMDRDKSNLILSMDEHEEVTDLFQGAKVWWYSRKTVPNRQTLSIYPGPEDHRYYRLIFHRAQRKLIHETYLPYVMEQGKAIKVQKRQRKLFTNNSHYDWFEYKKLQWTHVAFEHPATFQTIAMDPERKNEIVQDLLSFANSKEYYTRVGKPWKRGYLLYGPPGTGKSTMIAAMANLMDYDVYDLELTAVKDNTALRKLLIETTSKSIIVIEDIDCSLDLSGKRKSKKAEDQTEEDKAKAELKRPEKEESKVTLSGLLNFIDGLWSACGSERLIVFTTNYADQLDPALVRRGRMDMHIELSYCKFPAFKVLAKNYLGIEDHALFGGIEDLMEQNEITPADVAENLMPKTLDGIAKHDVETSLRKLIEALKECKPKAGAEDEVEAAYGETESQKPKTEVQEEVQAVEIESKEPATKATEKSEAANGETDTGKLKTEVKEEVQVAETKSQETGTEAANGETESQKDAKK